jgi:DHA1 family multidrug resistance protein-like MFS transporter
MPVIGSGFFTVGVVTLFNAVLNYLGISYPAYAASIFAGNALFRASFGEILPLFVSFFPNPRSFSDRSRHNP